MYSSFVEVSRLATKVWVFYMLSAPMQFLLHFFLIFGLFLFFGENAQSAGEHMQYAQGKAHEKKQMGWPKTQARGARRYTIHSTRIERVIGNSTNPIHRSGRQCGPAQLGARLLQFSSSLFFLFFLILFCFLFL
jgi:hypothetical protein